MSSYENYDATSTGYDRTRWPVGLECVLGCLAQGPAPLAAMTVLDAGCGTGNYTRALTRHVARVVALDRSTGMLEMARAKLEAPTAAGQVVLCQASIEQLPLSDASVDGVMVNQVLHHLGDGPAQDWSAHRQVLAEMGRVLKPGGVLVVNTCSQIQVREAFWASQLIPEACERMAARIMPLERLEAAMEGCGLVPRGRLVPADALIQGRMYLDPCGPLDPAWRAGDSLWALVRPEELSRMTAMLRDLDRRGKLEAFVAEHDARRPEIGQVTVLYALKGAA